MLTSSRHVPEAHSLNRNLDFDMSEVQLPGGLAPPPPPAHVPENLHRATLRLEFPPSYVLVGVYRLCADKNLRKAAWDKCKHGFVRGAVVGLVWVCFETEIQPTKHSHKG